MVRYSSPSKIIRWGTYRVALLLNCPRLSTFYKAKSVSASVVCVHNKSNPDADSVAWDGLVPLGAARGTRSVDLMDFLVNDKVPETENDILHYSDVIMGAMASQITGLTIVYLTVYSGAHQRKHQGSASLPFVRGIHRWPVNSTHKWPMTWKLFSFDDVTMDSCMTISILSVVLVKNPGELHIFVCCEYVHHLHERSLVICFLVDSTWNVGYI